jgi:RimJ/RimL family protein N-acetyltransferase
VDYNVADVIETGVQADLVNIKLLEGWSSMLMEAWDWLQEFPQNNFDDFGPKNHAEFVAEIGHRRMCGERIWFAYVATEPVGIIGYAPLNSYCGTFHGICFAKEWHGKGVARAAVSKVIDEIFASGQQKISASFFDGNIRIYRFLLSLKFRTEGELKAQTLQGGKPVDMRLMRLLREEW